MSELQSVYDQVNTELPTPALDAAVDLDEPLKYQNAYSFLATGVIGAAGGGVADALGYTYRSIAPNTPLRAITEVIHLSGRIFELGGGATFLGGVAFFGYSYYQEHKPQE